MCPVSHACVGQFGWPRRVSPADPNHTSVNFFCFLLLPYCDTEADRLLPSFKKSIIRSVSGKEMQSHVLFNFHRYFFIIKMLRKSLPLSSQPIGWGKSGFDCREKIAGDERYTR